MLIKCAILLFTPASAFSFFFNCQLIVTFVFHNVYQALSFISKSNFTIPFITSHVNSTVWRSRIEKSSGIKKEKASMRKKKWNKRIRDKPWPSNLRFCLARVANFCVYTGQQRHVWRESTLEKKKLMEKIQNACLCCCKARFWAISEHQ